MYADKNFLENDNIIYTVDMLRLKTNITYAKFTTLEFLIKTSYSKKLQKTYISRGISDFKYNYSIELEEGKSYWFRIYT